MLVLKRGESSKNWGPQKRLRAEISCWSEGRDFVLEGNVLDDKQIDTIHYMSVKGHFWTKYEIWSFYDLEYP